MDHADLNALVAAYALHGLDEDEARRVERHLLECAECRADLDGYRGVLGELLQRIPEQRPAPELRARVLDAVTGEQRRAEPKPATEGEDAGPEVQGRVRVVWPRRALLALGSYAAVATAAAVYLAAGEPSQVDSTRSEAPQMPPAFALRSRPVLTSGPLSPARAALVGVQGRRVLVMVEVPKPKPDQVWQVWALSTGGDAAVPVVSFDESQSSVAVDLSRVPEADVVAITLESQPVGPGPSGVQVLQTPI